MDYLINPFSQDLQMPDFRSSAAGLHHFAVVKNLFHLVQIVALVTLPSFYFFVKGIVKKGFLSLFSKGILTLVVLPLVIGLGGVLIGFDQFFTLFHQILFVGDDTWLFDPAKDPVILILPETFFLHAFLLFLPSMKASLVFCTWKVVGSNTKDILILSKSIRYVIRNDCQEWIN